MSTTGARVVIEVMAGLVPGQTEATFTRRWTITTDEWERATADDKASDSEHAFACALLLAFRAAEADEYARLLRNSPPAAPSRRCEWVWL